MKQLFRSTVRKSLSKLVPVAHYEELLLNQPNTQLAQVALAHQYRQLAREGKPLPTFAEAGFREFSQFEEDGILLLLFSVLPSRGRTCVEICAGTGMECNTANLIINHGWTACLFDGDETNVQFAREFYARHRDTFVDPPNFQQAWITAENVNELIGKCMKGSIDLLSLDIDGMDYWVWKSIEIIDPTVVVCEVHNLIPPDRALTVPYDPKFVFQDEHFRSASLLAMTNLGREKGYRLVGTHRRGFNAFFIKNGVGEELFPEISPESCAQDSYTRKLREEWWPKVKDMGWQEV